MVQSELTRSEYPAAILKQYLAQNKNLPLENISQSRGEYPACLVNELFFPVPAVDVLPGALPHHAEADTGEGHGGEQGPALLAGQVDPGEKWIKSEPTSIRNIYHLKVLISGCDPGGQQKAGL